MIQIHRHKDTCIVSIQSQAHQINLHLQTEAVLHSFQHLHHLLLAASKGSH